MDELISLIGEFGFYQKTRLLVIGFISSLMAMTIYSTIFTAHQSDVICSLKLNQSVIVDETSKSCLIWSNLTKLNDYDCKIDAKFYSGFVNEWHLVCDKSYLVVLTQTMYMIGRICGLPIGFFADRYGRKNCALVLSCILCIVLVILEASNLSFLNCSINAKFIIYSIGQFLIGLLAKAIYLVLYVLLIETTSSKYSTIVSNVNLYLYVLGEIFVLVVAYLYKDWHVMNITMAAYSFLAVIFIILVIDESPRYLINKGNHEKAYKLLNKIAESNGKNVKISKDIELFEQQSKTIKTSNKINNSNEDIEYKNSPSILKEMWSPKSNLLKTFIFVYIWLSLNLVYYGISLGITNIDSQVNPYIMYLISSLAEIIGYASCHFNDKFGRKKMLMIFLVLSSVVCIIVAFMPPADTIFLISTKMILVFVGKACASAAFNSSYIYNSLLYSTSVRSTIVLFASNCGNIGSLISPQINSLQQFVWKPLPYLIFSGSSLFASFFISMLPDPEKIKFL